MTDPNAVVPLLPTFGALNALHQDANPVSIITSGLERVAERVFFASGKWRLVDRYRWWNDYQESTPVIVGHYWRWPTVAARAAYSRGEPDLFKEYASNQWFGAQKNVFCVDFAVGARYKEREAWSSRAVSKPILPFPELQAILSDRIVPTLPHAALKAA